MKKLLLLVLFCPLLSMSDCQTESLSRQERINCLEDDIQKTKERRDYYRAKAAMARDRGDRMQFQNHEDLSDAQRDWKKADEYDEMARSLDQDLLKMEQNRDQLLKEKK